MSLMILSLKSDKYKAYSGCAQGAQIVMVMR